MNKHASPETSSIDFLSPLQSIERMVVDAGLSPAAFFRALQADVKQTPDPQRALNNLQRFLAQGFSATLLRDFQQHRVLQQIALELFSQSQYLADIVVRNPELFHWLTTTAALQDSNAKSTYREEAKAAVAPLGRFDKKLNALRRFHRRELLRIGAREIFKNVDVSVTALEISRLADAVVAAVVDLVQSHLLEGSGSSFESTFAVIGLGKLGGEELNFSSDIDLMFVYEKDGEVQVPQLRVKTLHEFYTRMAELTIRTLTERTGESHLYRVDMRLRPEGEVGALVFSRAAAMTYYETRGELWERQMLIKARTIAGNTMFGERLLHDLLPFVFPRTHSGSPLAEIAGIKAKIEAKVGADANIKLGSGGIRDIEFIVQALQLLNAGRNEQLRERNTLDAIDRLAQEKFLKPRERRRLVAAYRFFRLVEHRLQLLHGMQTHSLPESAEERRLLAKRLGFRTTQSFQRQLAVHRLNVRTMFSSVFALKKRRQTVDGAGQVSSVALKRFGFREPQRAREMLGKILRSVPELRERERLESLLRVLKKLKAPDWGLQSFFLLSNNPAIRRSLLQSFQNEKLLELIVLVCSRSQRLAQLLAQQPLLFETLLNRPEDILGKQRGWELQKSDPAQYQSFNECKALIRWLAGETSIRDATGELSALAEEIVVENFRSLYAKLRAGRQSVPIALVALGKFGGKEITVGSDLDLLLIYRKVDESSPRNAEDIARAFVAQFEHSGSNVYDIDMRLRPEGKNAPLAVELSYYREYLHRRASLWERQSLVKLRGVAGDERLLEDVRNLAQEYVAGAPHSRTWTNEILRMRAKMERERSSESGVARDLKVGRGGLVDIEFLVQMLQMRFGSSHPEMMMQNTFDALEVLCETKILTKKDAAQLIANLAYLRELETFMRLNSLQSGFIFPHEKSQIAMLAAAMGERSAQLLLKRIRTIQRTNRNMFRQTCNRIQKMP